MESQTLIKLMDLATYKIPKTRLKVGLIIMDLATYKIRKTRLKVGFIIIWLSF